MDVETFRRDGALRLPGLMAGRLKAFADLSPGGPGTRLQKPGLELALAPVTSAARQLIGAGARPVRAVLFDKTANENWALGWHQDRTIVVRQRREVEGFGPWSTKQRILHVAPPVIVVEGMATLRIHLDPCGLDNAPLKVALGSHRIGWVSAGDAAARAAEFPRLVCEAAVGDVWAYSTPILHASDRAGAPSHRRVLQVDYAAVDLPGGLEWGGVEADTAEERARKRAEDNSEAIADYNRRIRDRGTIGSEFKRW